MHTHHQAESLRYAEMKSSMNNKTFNGPFSQSNGVKSNLKSKFAFFQESLNLIESQTRALTQDTHKSLRKCEQFKTSLGNQMLDQYKILCKDQIKNVEKSFLVIKTESEDRTKQLWNGCKSMVQQSEHLKNSIKQIQNRIEKIQVTLGFYNAQDKMHKF